VAVATVWVAHGGAGGIGFGAGGWRALGLWGGIAALGLGAVLQTSVYALSVLKGLGGLYLLWLAYGAARAARASAPRAQAAAASHWWRRGVLLNLSNPKAVLAWMATLSLALDTQAGLAQVFVATALCAGIGAAIYAGYAIVFSTPHATRGYRTLRRWIDATTALVFALSGLALIRSAVAR